MAFGSSNSPTSRISSRVLLAVCAAILVVTGRVALAADASNIPVDISLTGPQTAPDEPLENGQPPSVRDYMLGRENDVAPLGIDVQVDQRTLKSGEEKVGLLVVAVTPGGPAARAGLRVTRRHRVKTALEIGSVAGAFFFPPAMFLVPILESTSAGGESADLIVAVDGFRVTDLLDLNDCLRDVQPGEIVYLRLVRDGQLTQLPIALPATAFAPHD